MKKTLLALAVMTAAGTANAGIEIYNQDKVTVDMTGDIEVVYMNGLEDGKDMQQEIQDADLGFDVRYASSESLALGAYWEFTDSGQSTGDAYVAAYTDFGSFKVGRLCTALDDAGIGSDYQYGIGSFFSNTEVYCADEVVRYDLDKENYYVTVGLAQDKNGDIDLNEDSTYFDTRFGVRVADFDFTGLFGTGEMGETDATKYDETLWGVEARFSGIDKLGLAVAYYNLDNDTDTTDTIALSADFQVTEVVALSGGYSMGSHDDSRLDADKWFVNAGYSVAPNAVVYAEVGGTTQDHQVVANTVVAFEDQVGLALGAKVEF
ncbi:porin [Vibrio crassostreae]|uniref:porin n=1 Tax=Vibrio crassostreae TaxID=246167 RepID=UPI001B30C539|nr:porin [Vibrio crassostreae]